LYIVYIYNTYLNIPEQHGDELTRCCASYEVRVLRLTSCDINLVGVAFLIYFNIANVSISSVFVNWRE